MYGNQSNQLTDDELIVRRVKKQRSKLFGCARGTHTLMGFLPIEVSDKIATFATDGKMILVNRSYAESINDLDARGIMIHESLHIGLKHHLRLVRWMKRCALSDEDARELWNMGADYAINGSIKNSPNYGIDFTLPNNVLWDDHYSTCGWPVEKICNDILRKGWKPKPKQGGSGGGGQSTTKAPPQHGCGEILAPQDCEGDSQEAKDAMAEEERSVNCRVAEASMLERQAGQGVGSMIDKIFTSTGKTTSSEHIRYFLKKNFSHVRSYKRPNRRFLHRKIYLPSRVKTPHTLYACIDSSASMGRNDFEKCRKNLVRWAKELGLSKIRVAYVDSVIHKNPDTDKPWYDIDLKNGTGADAMELNIFGGGGTSFDPIFDYIDRNNEDVGGLVYFTDGYGSVRQRSPSFPVLWVTTARAPRFGGREFGKVVHI